MSMNSAVAKKDLSGLSPNGYRRGLLAQAVILTLGTAAMTISVLPYRFTEFIPFGVLFSLVVLLQIVFSFAAILRPSRRLFRYAFCGTLGIGAFWFVALTIGLPFGPFSGKPEPVSVPDVFTLL